jgi:hypothetical protein
MAMLLNGLDKDYTNQRPEQALNDIYLQILHFSVPESSRHHIIKHFQMVGTIILLWDPLPTQALANLLTIDIVDMNRTLSHLHSIIAPSC